MTVLAALLPILPLVLVVWFGLVLLLGAIGRPRVLAPASRSAALALVLECAFALLLALLLVPWGGAVPAALWWPIAALVVGGVAGAALRWPGLPWTPPGRRPRAAWIGLAANAVATVLLGVVVLG